LNSLRTNAFEDLGTIRSFLEEGQRHFDESGFHFILWGTLIPVATIAYWFIERNCTPNNPVLTLFWPIIGGFGALVSFVIGFSTGKKRRVKNFATSINGLFWQGFFIAAILLSLIDILHGAGRITLYLSHLAILLGLAYWIHGSILRLRWFRGFALIWWVASPVLVMLDWSIASWVMAGTTFLSSLVPGIILRRAAIERAVKT